MIKRYHRTAHYILPSATNGKRRIAAFLLFFTVLVLQGVGQQLHKNFLNPPPDARPIMRWWWFGPAVTKPELRRELETMRTAGIGGVEIQPVYPLELDNMAKGINNLPYLSSKFLDDLSFANTTARSLGLRVDITLGSGWPYGGPKTTLALSAGCLRVISVPITGLKIALPQLEEGDSLIAAFAVSGTAMAFDPASAKRIDLATGAVPSGAGNRTALLFIASHTHQIVKRAAVGAEGYVLDHFARAAIDEHLADVATPLLNAFGDKPPYSVFSDSLEVYGSDWTEDLPAEFERRRGYDLIQHLPELLAGGTQEADGIRHDWGQTLSDMIRDSYLAPVTRFAESHHTRFRSQTYGEPAVMLADEAIPNLPEGEGPQWRAFSFTRWASSASHLYGRNITSAETWTWLHSPAFRATPLDMKVEADRMFLLGVNQIVGHGYPYSPPSAGEPGWTFYAAGAFNSHNPWFPVMTDVMSYLQRMSWLLRQGKPANDVAILLPEDDAQAAFSPGHVSVTDEMKNLISPQLMSAVLDAGYNIDYIDSATINKLGGITYPVMILPSTNRIALTTYKIIAHYAANGGKLIAVGKIPSLTPGFKEQRFSAQVVALSEQLFRSSGHVGIMVNSDWDVADALHRSVPPDLDAIGKISGLGFIHRKLPMSDIYYVVNTSNTSIDGSVRFRSSYPVVQSWCPDDGTILQTFHYNDRARIPLVLAPYESRVFVLQNKSNQQLMRLEHGDVQAGADREKEIADLSAGWEIRFSGNARTQSLSTLTSWSELPDRRYYSGEAVYTNAVYISRAPSPKTRIILDFGKGTQVTDTRPPNAPGMRALFDSPIREAAIIFVNHRRVGSLWHPPYQIDISRFIHHGANQIEVHVYNTAINELAGQRPRNYSGLNARYGKRFDPQDMNNLRPLPSGLEEPVRLEGESK